MKGNPIKQAIVRACADAAYRARLLAAPRKALAEEGIKVPADIDVQIHENSDNKIVAVLPGPQVAEIRERTRLKDRGTLEWGAKADVNLIDYENLHVNHPELVHDLPAGMPRLMQTAKGYVATYVSGQAGQENGQDTGARPGKIVRAT